MRQDHDCDDGVRVDRAPRYAAWGFVIYPDGAVHDCEVHGVTRSEALDAWWDAVPRDCLPESGSPSTHRLSQ